MNETENRTSAIGLCLTGRAFAEAAIALIAEKSEGKAFSTGFSSMPIIFLTGHAWELTQKALLRAEGVQLGTLKNLGHSLVELQYELEKQRPGTIMELLERGALSRHPIATEEGLRRQLQLLTNWHGPPYDSRYIITGVKRLGDMEFMLEAVSELSAMIEPRCLEAYRT